MDLPALTPDALRAQTVGADAVVETPFGRRPLVYADYTASGRQLAFVEDHLRALAALYANAHTEDSLTGRTATGLLHQAEAAIKRAVNAGPGGKVVSVGTGSTAAIHKLQEILGVAVPPATLDALAGAVPGGAEALRERGPVVFVGPYEHHSNEVTWREGLCTVVGVPLDGRGQVCLDALGRALDDPRWAGRTKIGSFSAGSNVTGVLAPVREMARALHARGALALFDYAAAGPYVEVDMTPEGDPGGRLDAVFLSPHKFLGGPGASGLLVFDEALYRGDLAPTVGGGGTVSYVNEADHDYADDVEAREAAGTPGLFQTLRAAFALEVKRAVGVGAIRDREHRHLARALDAWGADDRVEILGPDTGEVERLSILSFNVRDGRGGWLHPRFVTVLLDDLFGVQSRAGCSCAGPYGHRLLGIGAERSARYRRCIADGLGGLKPGWARVGLHYAMDDDEVGYVLDAVRFVAAHGARFLALYDFDLATGAWTHRDGRPAPPAFDLGAALGGAAVAATCPPAERRRLYAEALAEAGAIARGLPDAGGGAVLEGDLADLQFFAMP